MVPQAEILLFVPDRPVFSSLKFSLAIEGFDIVDGTAEGSDPSAAAGLVIDQSYLGDGLAELVAFRRNGCATPTILLATNPTARLRAKAAAARAEVVEKPLFGDELSRAIRAALETRKAA